MRKPTGRSCWRKTEGERFRKTSHLPSLESSDVRGDHLIRSWDLTVITDAMVRVNTASVSSRSRSGGAIDGVSTSRVVAQNTPETETAKTQRKYRYIELNG